MTNVHSRTVGAAAELHEEAARNTGLTDFGTDDYSEALDVLLRSLDSEAGLNDVGRATMRRRILGVLETRLRAQQALDRNPGHRDVPIERPMFVTGLPRTGTTALHRLLAADPRHQALELWLGDAPQPRPRREEWPASPDYRRTERLMDERRKLSPEINGVHFQDAEAVEECLRLERQTFRSGEYVALSWIPGYVEYTLGRDLTPVYERHRALLQLIGLNDQDKRWVLKYPGHLFGLDELLAAYPDAIIVQTHRDPRTIVASVCSLSRIASKSLSDTFGSELVGKANYRWWSEGIDRGLAARERYGADRFVDVYYHDFVRDPVGAVESIYERCGAELSDESRAAIAEAHALSLTGERKPSHRYDLADFGLDADEVGKRFGAYLDAFPAVVRN
ncbi:hypothetical protein BJF79_34090 [Actinomadura sp. CNU-125]|uniref:sulfotransferase family protein n=1 Tax=Actinomadura sp. CNU-125 TaxID=1904961 RepID=UPI0009683F57|nr:sulfotransferase [Actinomadura sp. CNU-125]OLT33919.1 hypothetical protein BJF79_34090 [Actinomadura sp. CNU-125]